MTQQRIVASIEAGPHPGLASLARDLVARWNGALAFDPSVSDRDRAGAAPLALALARLQANCRALGRCPPDAPGPLVCTSGFLDDALFVQSDAHAALLAETFRAYGRKCGVGAHVCLVLDLPLDEMHAAAVEHGAWPWCSVGDLSDLPRRFEAAAARFRLAPATLARVVRVPPHFDHCECDRAAVLDVLSHSLEALVHRAHTRLNNNNEQGMQGVQGMQGC